jgi:hypothetical protein
LKQPLEISGENYHKSDFLNYRMGPVGVNTEKYNVGRTRGTRSSVGSSKSARGKEDDKEKEIYEIANMSYGKLPLVVEKT